jgi:hypothetical protein
MQWVTDQVGKHSENSGSLNYWLAIDFAGDVGVVGGVAGRQLGLEAGRSF